MCLHISFRITRGTAERNETAMGLSAAAERESAKADEHEQTGGRLRNSNPRTCSLSAKAKRGVAQGIPHCCTMG